MNALQLALAPEPPRPFWLGLSDGQLEAARDEYRTHADPELLRIADDLDDDLARREADRQARAVSA